MVNAIEVMRKQLEDVQKAADGEQSGAAQAGERDGQKLFDLEARLLEPAQMTSDDK